MMDRHETFCTLANPIRDNQKKCFSVLAQATKVIFKVVIQPWE
jgi:hypothetical protein